MLSARTIALSAAVLCGCALRASPGHLEKLEPDPSFVKAAGTLWIQGPAGVSALRLDGSGRTPLFPAGLSVVDVADDGARALLRDAAGALLVSDANGLRALPEGTQAGAAALAPDGRTAAVFHRPRPGDRPDVWVEDDAVDLVNLETLAVHALPAEHLGPVSGAAFAADGHALWVQLQGRGEVISLGAEDRHFDENPPFPVRVPVPQRTRPLCPENGARLEASDLGIDLVRPGQPAQHLVTLAGKRRGLSDTLPAFDDAFFSPDCRAAVFVIDGLVGVVDLASGRAARLADGYSAFFAPEQASGQAQGR